MAKLLVVDDERNIRRSLERFFQSLGHTVVTAEGGPQAAQIIGGQTFDLILTDYKMAELNGLELIVEARRRQPSCLVILMTAYATVENAVAAMKAGAYDYVTKPFSLDQIQHVVERALELKGLQAENQALRDTIGDAPMLESQSPAMNHLFELAQQAAQSDATILLTGESGTGKNVLSRQIHRWSKRAAGPFVVVNCTTLSEELLESELFGHVRGSFTGAIKDKPGRLEAADKGTVFLDEIADLSPRLQAKFLRFVQEQSFERIGSDAVIRVDTRIIAASNRDLEAEVAHRHFREDLFHRLNVITLRVPALRERREDMLPLAEWMLRAAAIRNGRPTMRLSPDAAAAIAKYRWPGNARELRNALERAAVLSRSDVISRDDLPDAMFREPVESATDAHHAASLEELEREHIRRVLSETATLDEAAATLGINVTTLWRKRKRYGIE
ncbi:MAG TPA: sigma-54 dependent transcriptional regulator [Candidatus Binataceae bacterium]|nr:sigma-54 dependent transcriptional regulator [Candidatus Binataceae bacterium]